jgi:hypothetical protein
MKRRKIYPKMRLFLNLKMYDEIFKFITNKPNIEEEKKLFSSRLQMSYSLRNYKKLKEMS